MKFRLGLMAVSLAFIAGCGERAAKEVAQTPEPAPAAANTSPSGSDVAGKSVAPAADAPAGDLWPAGSGASVRPLTVTPLQPAADDVPLEQPSNFTPQLNPAPLEQPDPTSGALEQAPAADAPLALPADPNAPADLAAGSDSPPLAESPSEPASDASPEFAPAQDQPAETPPGAAPPSDAPSLVAPADIAPTAPAGPVNPLRTGAPRMSLNPLGPRAPRAFDGPPLQPVGPPLTPVGDERLAPDTQTDEPRLADAATVPKLPAADDATSPQQVAPSGTSLAKANPKVREPLFVDWPKPQVALVLTGQQHGYIEPCGCTGLENQKGGLARRHTFLKQLTDDRGWSVIPLDVGNQVRRYAKQEEIKFSRTADALRLMDYRAVVLGSDDLRLTPGELLVATNPGADASIFTGANVALLSRDLQPTFQVIEAGGRRIGVTAVLGDAFEKNLKADDIVHAPALAALREAAAELKKRNCDYLVLLAHSSAQDSEALAKQVPVFDLVVTSGGFGEPPFTLSAIKGTKSSLAEVGTKGMYAVVVGLYDDAKSPIRYQRVPLDDQFVDSPEIMTLFAEYQEQLQQMGLEELGARPQRHPTKRKFVGSETCGNCHTKAFAVWQKTTHAHATDSLVKPPGKRGGIARHFDPECLSCHVTGWEPEKFYPFESGYLSLEKTPEMQHNGCENCHSPGSAHVEAEMGDVKLPDAEIARRRNEMQLPIAGGVAEKKCMTCHDLDNSPDFHLSGAFAKYWKQVEHKGKN